MMLSAASRSLAMAGSRLADTLGGPEQERVMRTGTPLEWAQLLGVGPDDLPAQTRDARPRHRRSWTRRPSSFRMMLHGCPDRELWRRCSNSSVASGMSPAMIRELHREVVRELT